MGKWYKKLTDTDIKRLKENLIPMGLLKGESPWMCRAFQRIPSKHLERYYAIDMQWVDVILSGTVLEFVYRLKPDWVKPQSPQAKNMAIAAKGLRDMFYGPPPVPTEDKKGVEPEEKGEAIIKKLNEKKPEIYEGLRKWEKEEHPISTKGGYELKPKVGGHWEYGEIKRGEAGKYWEFYYQKEVRHYLDLAPRHIGFGGVEFQEQLGVWYILTSAMWDEALGYMCYFCGDCEEFDYKPATPNRVRFWVED